MKIKSMTAWQPGFKNAPGDWRMSLGQILVEVETTDGTVGVGVGGGGKAGIHVIDTVLSECVLVGEYETPNGFHKAMCDHTSFYGRKGIVPMAISGVDLAIWDAYAKTMNKSVYELLTDLPAPAVLPMYQTVFDDEEAAQTIESGKKAVKLHVERFGDRPEPCVIGELVRATRKRLGADKAIMLDAFGRWDVETTLRIADEISDASVDWIEEPVRPDQLDEYAYLSANSSIPIAGGEHEYLAEGFDTLANAKAVNVFQPDINWCGGLTSLIEIYNIAKRAGIRVVPHRGGEPYSLPAIAAMDRNSPLAESARSWFTCLDGMPLVQQSGITLNDGPGFGVAIKPGYRR